MFYRYGDYKNGCGGGIDDNDYDYNDDFNENGDDDDVIVSYSMLKCFDLQCLFTNNHNQNVTNVKKLQLQISVYNYKGETYSLHKYFPKVRQQHGPLYVDEATTN
jgi:hypothetical protein